MTQLQSFWVISSRIVAEERWYWYMGIMEYNMTRALVRFVGHDLDLDKIQAFNDEHWYYNASTEENTGDFFEVFQQDEQPLIVNERTAMVNDMRNHDLMKLAIKNPPKEGFKELPATLF